jgi:DNA-binding NarL/FixJ family response regulator
MATNSLNVSGPIEQSAGVNPKYQNKIIVVSGRDDNSSKLKAFKAEVKAYRTKPFGQDQPDQAMKTVGLSKRE